jgi:hypothetical protein
MSARGGRFVAAQEREAFAIGLRAKMTASGPPDLLGLAAQLEQLSVRFQAGEIDGEAMAAEAGRIRDQALAIVREGHT